MVSNTPLISVVMPVYNAEPYLAEAITSILDQTYSHFEFVIVDDGSTDHSTDVIRAFAARDARVRPLFRTHAGVACAANAGVALTRGELIARMDADDIALPERFAVQLAWMRRTGVDICGSCVQRFGDRNSLFWFPETHEAISHEFLFRAAVLHPTILMLASVVRTSPYDERTHFEDYELWTRVISRYRFGNVPRILLKYRCHPRQVHIRVAQRIVEELLTYRQRYFRTRFPEATEEDYAAFAHVANKEPLSHVTNLLMAGKWLAHLAQVNDTFLRQQMAQRWLRTCERSAHLGPAVYRLYREVLPAFGAVDMTGERKLRTLCFLRLPEGSRLYRTLAEGKRKAAILRARAKQRLSFPSASQSTQSASKS